MRPCPGWCMRHPASGTCTDWKSKQVWLYGQSGVAFFAEGEVKSETRQGRTRYGDRRAAGNTAHPQRDQRSRRPSPARISPSRTPPRAGSPARARSRRGRGRRACQARPCRPAAVGGVRIRGPCAHPLARAEVADGQRRAGDRDDRLGDRQDLRGRGVRGDRLRRQRFWLLGQARAGLSRRRARQIQPASWSKARS